MRIPEALSASSVPKMYFESIMIDLILFGEKLEADCIRIIKIE